MLIKELKNCISKKNTGKLYLFYGQENYLISYYINKIDKSLINKNFSDLNKTVYEGKTELVKIIENSNTYPVMADRKLIVAKNSGVLKSSAKSNIKELEDFFKNLPEYICIIFVEDDIKSSSKAYKLILKYGDAVKFDYLKPYEIKKWITGRLKRENTGISGKAADLLGYYCNYHMQDIENELEKIILYSEGKKFIEIDDIENICVKSTESKVFDLIDLIAGKNIEKAYYMLDDMIEKKESVTRILYLIQNQFVNIAKVKEQNCKINLPGFVIQKLKGYGNKFNKNDLAEIITTCAEMDNDIKSGKIKDRTAAELLLAQIIGMQ